MRRLILLTGLLLLTTSGWAQTTDFGFDFRDSSSFVTDPSYAAPVITFTPTFPNTFTNAAGKTISAGWVSTANIGNRDRSAANDPRLAGITFTGASTTSDFRVTLPATGSWNVALAVGDQANSFGEYVILEDNGVAFATYSNVTTANNSFMDANGTVWTEANWVISNTVLAHTFTSTTLDVIIGNAASTSATAIAHLRVTQAGGGGGGGPTITNLNPTFGPLGTSVTISGTNFGATQGGSTVTFNGTTATPTSWNATTITAPVPLSTTTGNVVVTVGSVASNGVSFVVPAIITSLSPTSGPTGTPVTISGTGFGTTQGGSSIRFGSVAATPTSWSATSISTTVPSGAITASVFVTVTAIDSNGSPFTVVAGGGGGGGGGGGVLPPINRAPGWHDALFTQLKGTGNASPCPPNGFNGYTTGGGAGGFADSCNNVILAWSGGVFDSKRNRMILWGGGHGDYIGNEVYGVEFNNEGTCTAPAPCIVRYTPPSPPNTVPGHDVETLPAATALPLIDTGTSYFGCIAGCGPFSTPTTSAPNSRHTYGGLVYSPAQDAMYSFSGALNSNGGGSTAIWKLALASVTTSCAPNCDPTWTLVATTSDIAQAGYGDTTDVDPNTGLIWFANTSVFGSFDPTSNTWSRKALVSMDVFETAAIDPIHKKFFYLGGAGNLGQPTGITWFDISAGSTFTQNAPTAGAACNVSTWGTFPGVIWDPISKKVVVYPNGGNVVYYLDPLTYNCTSATFGSTVNVDYPEGSNVNGPPGDQFTFGHFRYDPVNDVYRLCNNSDFDCWYMTPRRGDPIITNSTGTTLTNQPVSIAQTGRQGDFTNPQAFIAVDGGAATALTTQCDMKNLWPDGSAKFGLVSFLIPSLPNGAHAQVTYGSQATCNNTGFLVKSDMLNAAYNFDAQIVLTGTASHTISALAILNAASSCVDGTGSDPDGVISANGNLCVYWQKGPIVTCVILEDRFGRSFDVNTDGGSGNPLHPRFEACFYPQTHQVTVGFTLENTWASTTPADSARDQTFSIALTVGTSHTSVFTNGSFDMIPQSMIHKMFCANGTGVGTQNGCMPGIVVDHDLAYVSQTKLIPHWDSTTPNASGQNSFLTSGLIASWTNHYTHATALQGDSTGIANTDKALDAAGDAPWHGPLPTWDIVYLISQDQGVLTEMLNTADLEGRIPYFFREADAGAGHGGHFDAPINAVTTLGRIVSINARTQVSLADTTSAGCNTNFATDKINIGPTMGTTPNLDGWPTTTTHWPNLAYASYLSTGEYAYYEEQLMHGAFAIAASEGGTAACVNSGGDHRQGAAGYWQISEERGTDWLARENILAASVAVDGSPEKAYLTDKLNTNVATWEGAHSIPLDVTGCVTAVTCSQAWTYGNFNRAGDSDGGPFANVVGTPLGSWATGVYDAQDVLNVTGPNVPMLANSHFQNAYSAYVISLLDDLGLCQHSSGGLIVSGSGCQIQGYIANFWINTVMNPSGNIYFLQNYVYPTEDQAGNYITSWAQARTFYATISSSWTPCNATTIDEGYAQEGMATLAHLTGFISSQGGFSGLMAYNNVASNSTVNCTNNSPGSDFSSASPKWDITPNPYGVTTTSVTPPPPTGIPVAPLLAAIGKIQ